MVDVTSDQRYAWTGNKHEEIFGSKRVPKLTGQLSVDLLERKIMLFCLFWVVFLGMTVD